MCGAVPEQRDMRETVRDFVARQVKPVALKSDRLEARERPLLTDLLDAQSQLPPARHTIYANPVAADMRLSAQDAGRADNH